jgi:hypothetical protein
MRRMLLALVGLFATLYGDAVRADPVGQRESYITWIEDRFTETWSWLLKDASVEIAGTTWQLMVQVPVREHGRPIRDPSILFTLTTPAAQPAYVSCPGVGIIVDGEALQGIDSDSSQRQFAGTAMKSVSFTVAPDVFRRIAGAKALEARLCNQEFVVDASVRATLHAFAAKVRSNRPTAAERKRYQDEQALHAFAEAWKPRAELRGEWRTIAGDEFVTFAAGANAQTFRVASSKCGQGLLGKMNGEDTPPLAAAGFQSIECVGGARAERLDLASRELPARR